MGFKYAVLGAGRQGIAAAYDMARWGDATSVLLADIDTDAAQRAAERVNRLTGMNIASAAKLDVTDPGAVRQTLTGIDAMLSAVPYYFNLEIARTALQIGTHMCDLGGNIDIARQQHALDAEAKQAGVSIIPNCGQVPGLGTTLMVYAIEQLDEAVDVLMWDGGNPRYPRPPFNYYLTFNIEGLTNEYAENAIFLRDGKITVVDTMTELETVEFPEPIGTMEAFVAGGGTDTMPWTYEGKLRTLQNKTLRWPGHFAQIRAFFDLGLWDLKAVKVGETEIIPREVFHTLFEPKVTFPGDEDIVIIRVDALGKKDGKQELARVDLVDYYDAVTGFTAMERCTGWSAGIVAEMMARGQTPLGAAGVETMVPAALFVLELNRRGIQTTTTLT
jgi:lysine 6-dehydrogenase